MSKDVRERHVCDRWVVHFHAASSLIVGSNPVWYIMFDGYEFVSIATSPYNSKSTKTNILLPIWPGIFTLLFMWATESVIRLMLSCWRRARQGNS
jgi:hypothetical protein